MKNRDRHDYVLGFILCADGNTAQQGDTVFNYYDQKVGVIIEAPDREGWFRVDHEDGTSAILNGERITTSR